ncbi:O-antigen ligase family protein [Deinococcus aetherius]|uniref:O-antigen ligase family protein n=1 Tax=Deinococcus aetherius TaxID=200252 RepID=UPI00222F0F9B|nr:O-antigen ligase family protein [Deinococcus aetherius]
MRKLAQSCEYLFVMLSLLFLSGGIITLLRNSAGADGPGGGDSLQQGISMGIYVITALLLILRRSAISKILYAGRWFWPLFVWVLLSCAWSIDPSLSIRRVFALLGTTIFGLYLADRFSMSAFLILLGRTLLLGAILSVIFVIFIPELGTHTPDGRGSAWRGIYWHKNMLGRISVISTITFALLSLQNSRHWWLAVLLSLGLLGMASSATGLFVLGATIFWWIILRLLRQRLQLLSLTLVLLISCGGGALIWLSENYELLLDAFGRDVTLTGRFPLWTAVVEYALRQPWIGYGYAAFWTAKDGWAPEVWSLVGWTVPHAHNGFLDIWLALGYIGVLLFVICVSLPLTEGLRSWREGYNDVLWPLLYTFIFALYNLTESSIVLGNSILHVLFVLSLTKLVSRQVPSHLRLARVAA